MVLRLSSLGNPMNLGSQALQPTLLSLAAIPEHELLRSIASGAYGQVWLARNRLGVYRAVKIVHRANFDHDKPFEREFAGIKAFEPISRSHDGMVDLLQVGRDDVAGYFYYVMELADDANALAPLAGSSSDLTRESLNSYEPRTLAYEVKHRGRLPLIECIQIGLSLTDALAHLHGHKLVHRDIKPSNIVFVGAVPKLADVGLVAAMSDARSFVGTDGFIPPEGPGTPAADLYSLGILLYVLSTGKSHQDFPEPATDFSREENHAQRLEFDAVVHKACQANARERYENAEQMHADLTLLKHGESVRARRATQHRWAMARLMAMGSLVAVLLLTVLWLINGRGSGHTPNAEAVRLYERGRWHYSQLTAADHAKALDYFSKAVQADPKFIEPYGEMTALYIWAMLPGLTNDQVRLQRTRQIADKVLAINPNLPEGHAAMSLCRFLERDWEGVESEINRAIQLNPNLAIPHQFYAFYLTLLGRTEEARRESQKADQLSPPAVARVSAIVAAWPYIAERRFDLAIAQLQRTIELDRNFPEGHHFLGVCYEAASNYLAAIEEWRTLDSLAGEDPAKIAASYDGLRHAYQTAGEQGYLRKWIDLVNADADLPADKRMFPQEDLAGDYARLGENAKALDEIEMHFDKFWWRLKYEPLFDPLHDEPRFKAMVKRAGLPQ